MKFGRQVGQEIETQPIDRVRMTETELHDLQQIAGVGCWAITRNGKEIQIQVTPDPEPIRTEHREANR